MVKVEELTLRTVLPDFSPKAFQPFAALFKSPFKPQKLEGRVSGTWSTLLQAVLRAAANLPCRRLTSTVDQMSTNDQYLIPLLQVIITERLNKLPVLQTIEGEFAIRVENRSDVAVDITTSDITPASGAFAPDVVICQLAPNSVFEIRKIVVEEHAPNHGLAHRAETIALAKNEEKDHLREDFKEWLFVMQTSGEIDLQVLFGMCCDVVIRQVLEAERKLLKVPPVDGQVAVHLSADKAVGQLICDYLIERGGAATSSPVVTAPDYDLELALAHQTPHEAMSAAVRQIVADVTTVCDAVKKVKAR